MERVLLAPGFQPGGPWTVSNGLGNFHFDERGWVSLAPGFSQVSMEFENDP